MISKEVITEALRMYPQYSVNDECTGNIQYKCNSNIIHFEVNSNGMSHLNTYELAHQCKEKAREYGFSIATSNRGDGTDRYDVLCIHKDEDIECSEAVFFNEIVDTEPNAIFMAMQWILDNRGNK